MTHGAIEVAAENNKEEKIEQRPENEAKRPPKCYLWAILLARIYNLFSLLCPECGAEMQIIAVIQDKPVIKKILESVSEPTEPPALSPTRGPPGWDDYYQDVIIDDRKGQSVPDYEFNQCVSW